MGISLPKGGQKIVCLTAYSAPMAAMLAPHVDVLLVGDSVGMVLYGMETTLEVTLDMMIAHGRAVVRGAESQNVMVVVDMPYGTYEHGAEAALKNARRIMDETACDAVKLEGAYGEVIAHLVDHGIPVMAHIGLQPQSVVKDGGFKVKGKDEDGVARLMDDARVVEEAGAFAVVIEGTIEPVAAKLSAQAGIPTIGIGASAACDGQILVTEDMLGLSGMRRPKFVKAYAELGEGVEQAVKAYADEVRSGAFPGDEHVY